MPERKSPLSGSQSRCTAGLGIEPRSSYSASKVIPQTSSVWVFPNVHLFYFCDSCRRSSNQSFCTRQTQRGEQRVFHGGLTDSRAERARKAQPHS